MPSRHVHTEQWVYVTYRDPDGKRLWDTNATAWVGTDAFDQRIAVLRRGLVDGITLDTSVADARHVKLVEAKARYDAAFAWWQVDTLGRPHPGSLTDWMEP